MKLYLALVQQGGATPVIVINKSDLENDVVGVDGQIDGIASDVRVHVISARARHGVHVLEQYFEGNRTVALLEQIPMDFTHSLRA
jgi:ribosome biogenesis GTPase / thiamine phosphate phosphatase